MFDELEALLQEALTSELRNRRGKGSVSRLGEIKRICHETYANPANWQPGRLIEVIHRDSGSFVGMFQELLHTKVAARRLIPAPVEGRGIPPQAIEYVEGACWLGGPLTHVVDPPTEGEIAAVRAYYRPTYWRPAWRHKRVDADGLLNQMLA